MLPIFFIKKKNNLSFVLTGTGESNKFVNNSMDLQIRERLYSLVKYGVRFPKFIWAPFHVMCTAVLIGWGSITFTHLKENSCIVKLPYPILKCKGKTGMVQETSHVKQLSPIHVCKIGLKHTVVRAGRRYARASSTYESSHCSHPPLQAALSHFYMAALPSPIWKRNLVWLNSYPQSTCVK